VMEQWYIETGYHTLRQKTRYIALHVHCMLFAKQLQKAWVHGGFHKFKNGTIALLAHETSSVHVDATLQVKLKKSVLSLKPSIIEERRKQVAFNREIVSQLVEVTKFLGQHSLAFRGHRENWSSIIKGNFQALLLLLSNHSPAMSVHIANIIKTIWKIIIFHFLKIVKIY